MLVFLYVYIWRRREARGHGRSLVNSYIYTIYVTSYVLLVSVTCSLLRGTLCCYRVHLVTSPRLDSWNIIDICFMQGIPVLRGVGR